MAFCSPLSDCNPIKLTGRVFDVQRCSEDRCGGLSCQRCRSPAHFPLSAPGSSGSLKSAFVGTSFANSNTFNGLKNESTPGCGRPICGISPASRAPTPSIALLICPSDIPGRNCTSSRPGTESEPSWIGFVWLCANDLLVRYTGCADESVKGPDLFCASSAPSAANFRESRPAEGTHLKRRFRGDGIPTWI